MVPSFSVLDVEIAKMIDCAAVSCEAGALKGQWLKFRALTNVNLVVTLMLKGAYLYPQSLIQQHS